MTRAKKRAEKQAEKQGIAVTSIEPGRPQQNACAGAPALADIGGGQGLRSCADAWHLLRDKGGRENVPDQCLKIGLHGGPVSQAFV